MKLIKQLVVSAMEDLRVCKNTGDMKCIEEAEATLFAIYHTANALDKEDERQDFIKMHNESVDEEMLSDLLESEIEDLTTDEEIVELYSSDKL